MTPENILLIRLSSIGDVLHCTPVAQALREYYPKAKISWIVGEKSQDILHGNPYLDKIIVWQREQWEKELRKGAWLKSLENFRFLKQQLKIDQYDLTIDMQGLLLTGLIGWCSGAPMRIGFAKAREGSPLFYTHKVHAAQTRKQVVKHYLQLLGPLAIKNYDMQMVMPIAREHHEFAEGVFARYDIAGDQKVVVLNPSTSWTTKCWPAVYFSKLANLLQDKANAEIIILGGPGDIPLVEKIVSGISRPVINLAGRTSLKELAAVVQKSHLFIGGDTGPLHIAAAVGTPTISLFGPTDPRIYAPLGKKHMAIVTDVVCRNCHKRTCKNFICMDRIRPEEVCVAAQKMLYNESFLSRYWEATTYGQVPVKTIHSPL